MRKKNESYHPSKMSHITALFKFDILRYTLCVYLCECVFVRVFLSLCVYLCECVFACVLGVVYLCVLESVCV